MSAYLIASVEVTDWDRYREYMAATPGILAQFGGRFIARGGEILTLEGPEETRRVVLMEFPSMDQVRAFYDSKEYLAAKMLREGAATMSLLALEGL